MATHKQREESCTRKPRHRKNLIMEELPTFTKWLPSNRPDPREDPSSKSKRVLGYSSVQRKPVVLRDSPEEAGVVTADVSNLPQGEGDRVAMADSCSARGGCSCWQRSKSSRGDGKSRRRLVDNALDEGVSAGVLGMREEGVAAGGDLDKEGRGCWCCRCAGRGCLPTFEICGRRKVPAGVPNLADEGSGRRHSQTAKRRCLPTFHICGRREKVAAGVPNLHEEGVAIDDPDLRKGRSGSCCARWECLPAFQICRRRRKVAADKEEVTADVPNEPEEIEVATDVVHGKKRVDPIVVNMQEGVSKEDGFRSAQRAGCFQAFHICAGRKRVVGDLDTLEEGVASGGLNLHKEDKVVVADVSNLSKEGSGGCCCVRCTPTFQLCGRRKVASGSLNLHKEDEVVAADVSDLSKEGSGGCCCFRCMSTFQLCGRRRKVASGGLNLHKKDEVVAADVTDLSKEGSGGCYCFRRTPTFQLCGRRRKEASSDLNLHKEDEVVVADVSDLSKEGSGGCCCFRCTLTFQLCGRRRKVASNVPSPARDVKVVSGVSDLPEKKVDVAGVLELHGEVKSKSAQGGSCWAFKFCVGGWWPNFLLCGRRTVVGVQNSHKEDEVAAVIPNTHLEKGVAIGVSDPHKENGVVAGSIPDHRKEERAAVDGILDHRKEERVTSGDIPILTKEEKVSAGDAPNLHKEEKVSTSSVPDIREEEAVATGIHDLQKEEEASLGSGVSDLGEEEEGGCRCFKPAGKKGGRRHRRRSSRSRERCWPFQICGRRWLSFLICRGRKRVSVSIPNLREEEGLVVNGVSDVHEEVVAVAGAAGVVVAASHLREKEVLVVNGVSDVHDEVVAVTGATGVVAAASHSESTEGCSCWQSKRHRRWPPRKTVATGKEDSGSQHAKSKRRRGCLGRRERRGRERQRNSNS